MSKYFITTPIYYVNDKPHIGHAYSSIAADVLARYHRQQGDKVLFSTGLDENSQKTVEAAEKAGKDVTTYTNDMATVWQKALDTAGISYDAFIRTTSPQHKKAVEAFMAKIKQGDLYKGEYEGLYCVGHEAFLRPDELVDGKCPEHNRAPEQRKEENYFFKLSDYQKPLLDYIKANPSFIMPETRRNEIVAFIERGLEDISVSRQKGAWGIDWPGDPSQKIYVWFDALVNYLTATGYPAAGSEAWWPADVHVVGKDIIKFHCIYWPAMLMSAGLPLPKQIFGHGFFTIDGQKISKSLGNAIDPIELAGQYGMDALRFYVLREVSFGGDGEFSKKRFHEMYNTQLANDLGNAVQRISSMITRYLDGQIGQLPNASHDVGLYHDSMQGLRLDRALEELWIHVRSVNQYIEEEKPWQLAKTDKDQLLVVLQQATADLLHISGLLMPFIPATADRIAKTFEGGRVNADVGMLFPKFE